jgi:hypothetical protein
MLACLDALRRIALQDPLAGNRPAEDQLLEAGSRQIRQVALQHAVEALSGILGIAVDFDAAFPAWRGVRRVIRHVRLDRLSPSRCAR